MYSKDTFGRVATCWPLRLMTQEKGSPVGSFNWFALGCAHSLAATLKVPMANGFVVCLWDGYFLVRDPRKTRNLSSTLLVVYFLPIATNRILFYLTFNKSLVVGRRCRSRFKTIKINNPFYLEGKYCLASGLLDNKL